MKGEKIVCVESMHERVLQPITLSGELNIAARPPKNGRGKFLCPRFTDMREPMKKR